jgi:hypothetical protein
MQIVLPESSRMLQKDSHSIYVPRMLTRVLRRHSRRYQGEEIGYHLVRALAIVAYFRA